MTLLVLISNRSAYAHNILQSKTTNLNPAQISVQVLWFLLQEIAAKKIVCVCVFVNSVIWQHVVDCLYQFFADGLSLPGCKKKNIHQSQQVGKTERQYTVRQDASLQIKWKVEL